MNWADVTIGQYQELHKTFDYEPTAPTEREREIQIADWRILQMSILKGESFAQTEDWVTLGELEKMKIFIHSNMPCKIYKRFKLNGIKYEFELDPTKLKGGSYMSLMKDLEEPYENMHKILYNYAHPYRYWFRKGWFYKMQLPFGKIRLGTDISEIHRSQEDFKEVPMSVANPLIVFFWNLSKVLTKDLEDSLNKQMKSLTKKTNKLAKDLVDGDG